MAGLRGETVRQWAKEAQDLDFAGDHAAGIARAIEPVAAAARAAEKAVPFDSEPADFDRAQRRWLGPRR
jgi:hypothetical protein